MPQIEGDAFLVAIERAETGAVAFVFRIAPAVRVAAVGQFDFNDFAAEIAEQAAGVGPGDVAADIDANRSLECSGDHACFKSSSSVISFIAIKKAFPPALRAAGSHRSKPFSPGAACERPEPQAQRSYGADPSAEFPIRRLRGTNDSQSDSGLG